LEKGVCPGAEELLAHVHVRRPTSTSSLTAELENLQVFLMMNNIRLIVIDSMAALTRKEMLSEKECSLVVSKQAAILLKLAAVCKCAVLTTNQACFSCVLKSFSFCDGTGSDRVQVQIQTSSRDGVHCSCRHSGDRARGDGQLLRRVWLHPLPSLSRLDLVTWIHCVSVRILMTTSSKREQNGPSTTTETNANNGGFTQRVMLLSKSPCAMPCCAPFAVGIRGVIA